MDIQQHFVALARVSHQPESATGAQLEVRHLDDVLVQLYRRFEAAYYAQILSHHADLAFAIKVPGSRCNDQEDSPELF